MILVNFRPLTAEFDADLNSALFRQVTLTGSGDPLRDVWWGNYWDDYQGSDRDHNGIGNTPHEWSSKYRFLATWMSAENR